MKWNKCEIHKNSCIWVHRTMFASNLSHRDRKLKYLSKFWTKHGGDGKRWPFFPFPFLAPWPSRPIAIETPPRPVPAGPLISSHDPRTHHHDVIESHPERAAPLSRRDDERWHAIGSHSALALRLYLLQPITPPQVAAFESWTISAPICLNRFTPFPFLVLWPSSEKYTC